MIIGAGGLFLLLLCFFFFWYFRRDQDDIVLESKQPEKIEKQKKDGDSESTEEMVSVDIKGEVNVPGMYSVKTSMRVLDVILQAGGLTDNADTSVINLSKKVMDEMVIIIYSRDQVQNFEKTKEMEVLVQDKCKNPENYTIQNNACIDSEQTLSMKININTASKEELMTLNGIGDSKAKDILSYREQNGFFHSIEEIKNVPGIGENIYAQIKENITV